MSISLSAVIDHGLDSRRASRHLEASSSPAAGAAGHVKCASSGQYYHHYPSDADAVAASPSSHHWNS